MKIFNTIAVTVFLVVVGVIAYNVISDSHRKYYVTTSPSKQRVENKLFIPGSVYPIKEIEIKSQLSGVIDELFVKIGDEVHQGRPIATIRLVPNSSDIEQLENNLKITRIEYEAQKIDYERNKQLYSQRTISKVDMEASEKAYFVSEEKYRSAQNQLNILRRGYASSKDISNTVKSSTDGIIIDIPVEVGSSIIERNNYNVGTTIAVLAEMNRFIFRAQIDEQYLKYISLGTKMRLTFNAYDSLTVDAAVTKIAAKGTETTGIVKFAVDAEFDITPKMPVIRSGYSATAEALLQQAENVLTLPEKCLTFRQDSICVYVLDSLTNKPVQRLVKTGISDGSLIEIVEGLTLNEKVITNYSDPDD